MKKKIKDLTPEEREFICNNSRGCDYCPLYRTCIIDLEMSKKSKKKFYKDLEKEVEIQTKFDFLKKTLK